MLQHPAEAQHAKGSLHLLALSLSNCRCMVGEQFDPLVLGAWLGSGTALLYPAAPGAAPGASASMATGPTRPTRPTGPNGLLRRLVVLDGTWRQSRSLLHLNPSLQPLPRVTLGSLPPAQYRIRKAHQPDQRSTLEATCLALGTLEHRPAHYAPLLLAFEGWIAALEAQQALGSGQPLSPW